MAHSLRASVRYGQYVAQASPKAHSAPDADIYIPASPKAHSAPDADIHTPSESEDIHRTRCRQHQHRFSSKSLVRLVPVVDLVLQLVQRIKRINRCKRSDIDVRKLLYDILILHHAAK